MITAIPQTPQLAFSPCNGRRLPRGQSTNAKLYRDLLPIVRWKFNPWTGTHRHHLDIDADPLGRMILPPNVPIRVMR